MSSSIPIQPDQFRHIPSGRLILSPLNVRKTGAEEGIEELAALIRSQGVVQNLTVYAEVGADGTDTGNFAVVAGGRRWRAIQLLLQRQQITAEYPVPCLVTPYERAVELSLTENSGRVAMHPADQFEAFRALVDAGQSVEDVAGRFGVAPLVVQRRLKLANIAPRFIALYRDDNTKMTLEHLMALAITDDQERQERVWDSLKPHERYPQTLRERLTEREIEARHPLARYVGLKAYEKAGGAQRRDLFSDEEHDVLLDSALVHELAAKKLEKQAEKLRAEGLPWVDVHLHMDYATRAAYGTVGSVQRDPSAEEQERLDALTSERERLNAETADSEDEDGQTDLSERLEALDSQIDQLTAQLEASDPEQQALAGAVVSVGSDGKIRIERDLLRSEDARRFKGLRERTARKDAAPREHSAALMRRLTAHRTLALQAELAQQPTVAVIGLTHRLVLDTFYLYSGMGASAVQVHGEVVGLTDYAQTLEGCEAQRTLNAQREALEALLPDDEGTLLEWLLQVPHQTLMSLLAYCVAVKVDGVRADEGPNALDGLASAAKLDMRKWWTAGAQNYFGAIPKVRILAAVTEGVSAQAAAGLEKLKKGALAEAAERQLAGSGWLPKVLRPAQA